MRRSRCRWRLHGDQPVRLRRGGSGAELSAALRLLAFDPADNQVVPGGGVATTFTLTADDGLAAPVGASTTVVAASVNDDPEGAAATYKVRKGRTRKLRVGAAAGLLRGASDPDPGTVLRVALVSAPPRKLGRLAVSLDGSFVFKPRPFFRKTFTFLFRVEDNRGGCSDALAATAQVRRPR